MFIQVKDWKNEGQDVAPTACSQSVLQSVNPQSSSLHLNPEVVAVQIFPNPALRSTQQVQIKAERCKTLWCKAEFIFSLTLILAALQSRKHQNINSSILSELPWSGCKMWEQETVRTNVRYFLYDKILFYSFVEWKAISYNCYHGPPSFSTLLGCSQHVSLERVF